MSAAEWKILAIQCIIILVNWTIRIPAARTSLIRASFLIHFSYGIFLFSADDPGHCNASWGIPFFVAGQDPIPQNCLTEANVVLAG
jgi:hypothetical protein